MSLRLSDFVLRTQTDERLVDLARAGHEPAFAVLVERYRRPLTAHAHRILRDGRSEDVVQEGFVRAWTSLHGGAELHNVRAWLYRVVHNAALDAVRDRARADGELSEALLAGDDVARFVEERLRAQDTMAGLAALPGQQRDAMLMTAVEGRSGAEAAGFLGVSEGAVHQLVHRARGTLRRTATALTPAPLVMWAADGRNTSLLALLSQSDTVGGAASLSAAKLCAAVALTGAVAGGTVQVVSEKAPHKPSRSALAAGSEQPRGAAATRTPVAAAAFTGTARVLATAAATTPRRGTRAVAVGDRDRDTTAPSEARRTRDQRESQDRERDDDERRDDDDERDDDGETQRTSPGSDGRTRSQAADSRQGDRDRDDDDRDDDETQPPSPGPATSTGSQGADVPQVQSAPVTTAGPVPIAASNDTAVHQPESPTVAPADS